jgi:hypothetical protein
METGTLQLERLVDDPEIRRAAAKTLKGFCLTYLPHHFSAELSDFFDEMAGAGLQPEAARDHRLPRLCQEHDGVACVGPVGRARAP